MHVPGPPVLHRGSRSQGGPGAPSRIYYMTRNGLRVTRRRLGARPAARMLRRELGLARRELREGDRASGRARLRGIAHFLTGRTGRLR